MKKITFALCALIIATTISCKKTKAPQVESAATTEKTELQFNPGSAAKAKEMTLDFVRHTKFSTNKTTESMPDAPIFEGAYLLEAGANYLRNTNFGAHYSLTNSFDKDIEKVNSTTLSGSSMVQAFEELMSEIEIYEDGTELSGYLINGYIVYQDDDIAKVRFDVYFGDPDNSPAYVYPNSYQNYCDAAVTLTNGINFDLQIGNVFATGVISQSPGIIGGGSHPDPFYDNKAWWSTNDYGINNLSEWTYWHNNGMAIVNHFASSFCQQNNPNNPTAGCEVPVSVDIDCGFALTTPSTTRYHQYMNITLAQYLASY